MSRHYYRVPVVVDADGGVSAQVPAGISWVGAPCAENDCYLVLTMVELGAPAEPVNLDAVPDCCDAGAGTIASWKIGNA